MPMRRVALVFRGDRSLANSSLANTRLTPIVDALAQVDLVAEAAPYSDDDADDVRSQLLGVDGVLVWVDPISGNDDRTMLDALLRDVASAGVWVSAHPDTVLRMGTKEVIYETRGLGWGAETYLYRTVDEFNDAFPLILNRGHARVLKQHRGNGGIGVQKVEIIATDTVRVQSARLRDEATEDLPLREFMRRCAPYFGADGRLIDQPFQPRITDGIIRCYLVKGEVVGFARQYPSAAPPDADPSTPRAIFGLPSAKTMFSPDDPTFRSLRSKLESDWVPAMQEIVEVDAAALPALWDADFLFGPRDETGSDTYVLCEINVSAVLPFPPEAPAKLARATLAAIR